MTYSAADVRRCPDDGRCWHECVGGCFRVQHCDPLANDLFDREDGWPPGCVEVYGNPSGWVL